MNDWVLISVPALVTLSLWLYFVLQDRLSPEVRPGPRVYRLEPQPPNPQEPVVERSSDTAEREAAPPGADPAPAPTSRARSFTTLDLTSPGNVYLYSGAAQTGVRVTSVIIGEAFEQGILPLDETTPPRTQVH